MKKLAYINEDGSVAIIIPAPKESIEKVLGSLTDEEYEQHVRQQSIPEGVEAIQVDDDAIPTNREFRGAWKLAVDKIDFDLEKAKDIQLERIRRAREPILKELDVQLMIATEQDNSTKQLEIKEAKQKLRDITEPLKVSEPESIEDIKAAFPEELMDGQ